MKLVFFICCLVYFISFAVSVVYAYSYDPILSIVSLSNGFGILTILVLIFDLTHNEEEDEQEDEQIIYPSQEKKDAK